MINPGGSADKGKIQKDEEDIIKEILKKIREFINRTSNYLSNNLKKNNNDKKLDSDKISITLNGESIIKVNRKGDKKSYSIDPEIWQRVNKAIKQPQNTSDELKIKVGGKLVFHVRDRQIKLDDLGLTPAPKQEQNLSLEQKVEKLIKLVNQQQEKIDLLEKKIDRTLKFITEKSSQIENKKLGSWTSGIANKLSSTLGNIRTSIYNFINSSIQKAGEKIAGMSANFLEKPVNFMLNRYGKEENGVLSFQGKKYQFNKNLESGEISIFSRAKQESVVEKGNFTQSASPDDVKLLRNLPEKLKQTINKSQTQKTSRGISPA